MQEASASKSRRPGGCRQEVSSGKQSRGLNETYMEGTVVGGPGWVASDGKAAVAHCIRDASAVHLG